MFVNIAWYEICGCINYCIARELLSRIKRLEVGEFQTAHIYIIYTHTGAGYNREWLGEFKNHISYHTRVLLSFRWPNLLIIMHSAPCLDMQGLMHVMPARPYPFYNSDNMVRGAHLMLLPRRALIQLYFPFFVFSFSLCAARERETLMLARMLLLFCAMCPVYTNTGRGARTRLSIMQPPRERKICDWLRLAAVDVISDVGRELCVCERLCWWHRKETCAIFWEFVRISFINMHVTTASNWKSDGKKRVSLVFVDGSFFQPRPHVLWEGSLLMDSKHSNFKSPRALSSKVTFVLNFQSDKRPLVLQDFTWVRKRKITGIFLWIFKIPLAFNPY